LPRITGKGLKKRATKAEVGVFKRRNQMWQKIKKILNLYKNWFLSILKILFLICLLIMSLTVIILSAPFIISTKVQTVLQNMFDKIIRFMW
jgi:hypothetical protein